MTYTNNFLQGKTVLAFREKSQGQGLSEMISQVGGVPIEVPLLSFHEPEPAVKQQTMDILAEIDTYDWLVLTSKNGVDFTFGLLAELGLLLPKHTKLAVIGTKTAEQLVNLHYRVRFIPPKFVAEAFLPSFLEILKPNEKVLICKGNFARSLIATGLASKGHQVQEAIVYENKVPEDAAEKLKEIISKQPVDYLIFTSPSAVDRFMKIILEYGLSSYLQNSMIISIGPVTSERIQFYHLTVDISPEIFTSKGIMKAIYENSNKTPNKEK